MIWRFIADTHIQSIIDTIDALSSEKQDWKCGDPAIVLKCDDPMLLEVMRGLITTLRGQIIADSGLLKCVGKCVTADDGSFEDVRAVLQALHKLSNDLVFGTVFLTQEAYNAMSAQWDLYKKQHYDHESVASSDDNEFDGDASVAQFESAAPAIGDYIRSAREDESCPGQGFDRRSESGVREFMNRDDEESGYSLVRQLRTDDDNDSDL